MEVGTAKRLSELLFTAVVLCCIVVSLLPTSFIITCLGYFGAKAPLVLDLWPTMSGTAGAVGIILLIIASLASKYRGGIYSLSLGLVDKIDRLDEEFHTESDGFSGIKPSFFLLWICLCFVSVLILYWPSIRNGYFRYDDFEFISYFRNLPLLKTLVVVHGDHALPLYRLEVAIMYMLFGVNHVPYNVALLTLFCLTALFSVLILRELKTGQLGILLFLMQYIGWTLWGNSLTGYYCLSVYIQAALFCSVAIWSSLKWEKTGKSYYKKLFTLSVVLAVLVDLSGIYVPIAVGLFLFADFFTANRFPTMSDWFKKHLWFVWSLIIILIAYGIFLLYVYKVVNPGTFLSMNSANVVAGAKAKSSNVLQLYLFLTNGLVLSTLFSCYNIVPPKILMLINAIVLFAMTALTYYLSKQSADTSFKTYCFGIIAIILVIGIMVTTGRQSTGLNFVWPAKYSGPAYMWFCVLTAFCWNAVWKSTDRAYRPIVLQLAMIFVIAMLVLRVPYRYNDIGNPSYYYFISGAVNRYAAVSELRDKLIKPLFAGNVSEVSIPTLDGKFINSEYDQLFEYNLSHYLSFIEPDGKRLVLYRNRHMQEWGKTGVTSVPDLRRNISSNFMNVFNQSGYLQHMYTKSTPLSYKECHDTCNPNTTVMQNMVFDAKSIELRKDGSLMITSNGRTKMKVTHGKWDPQVRHVLSVDVTYTGQRSIQPELGVWFDGDMNIPYSVYQLKIDTFSSGCKTIDLLQLPAYSLNSTVGDIEVRFPDSGDYIVKMVKFE